MVGLTRAPPCSSGKAFMYCEPNKSNQSPTDYCYWNMPHIMGMPRCSYKNKYYNDNIRAKWACHPKYKTNECPVKSTKPLKSIKPIIKEKKQISHFPVFVFFIFVFIFFLAIITGNKRKLNRYKHSI